MNKQTTYNRMIVQLCSERRKSSEESKVSSANVDLSGQATLILIRRWQEKILDSRNESRVWSGLT
jgi:hypothetical protein